MRDFDLELSLDGSTWDPAVSGTLLAVAAEQSFALPAPVEARFARLRVRSVQNPASSVVVLGEWTVVATPGWSPPAGAVGVGAGGGIDIGSPERGGHVVTITPGFGGSTDHPVAADRRRQQCLRPRLGGSAGRHRHRLRARPRRAAGRADVGRPAGHRPGDAIRRARRGGQRHRPSRPMAAGRRTWTLDRTAGPVAPFEFPTGTWGRFVRLTGMIPSPVDDGSSTSVPDAVPWEVPDQIGVSERPIADDYRSVVGSWGVGRQSGLYERTVAPPVVELDPDAGDTAADATPLSFDRRGERHRVGRARRGLVSRHRPGGGVGDRVHRRRYLIGRCRRRAVRRGR